MTNRQIDKILSLLTNGIVHGSPSVLKCQQLLLKDLHWKVESALKASFLRLAASAGSGWRGSLTWRLWWTVEWAAVASALWPRQRFPAGPACCGEAPACLETPEEWDEKRLRQLRSRSSAAQALKKQRLSTGWVWWSSLDRVLSPRWFARFWYNIRKSIGFQYIFQDKNSRRLSIPELFSGVGGVGGC